MTRGYCSSSPWCEEDVCRCEKWEIEEQRLEAEKLDNSTTSDVVTNTEEKEG